MQLSALFRRAVVVACDDETEDQLRGNNIVSPVSVRLISLPDDNAFHLLHSTGLFEHFNSAFGTLIGDYEEDFISLEHLDEAIRIVDAMIKSKRIHKGDVIHRIRELLDFAKRNGRSVFFVL
ncbi:MAG: hypothetical protein ACFHWZ_07230 [Phycisphaerales bacterium]